VKAKVKVEVKPVNVFVLYSGASKKNPGLSSTFVMTGPDQFDAEPKTWIRI
jgi:hypothetical protein